MKKRSLGCYLIKYSRLYSTFSTKERNFIFLIDTGGSGKFHFIFIWLNTDTFQPAFDRNFNFYKHYQPVYSQMQRKKTLKLFKEKILIGMKIFPKTELSVCLFLMVLVEKFQTTNIL